MDTEDLTTEDLDYLQRGFEPTPLPPSASLTLAPPPLRRLLLVDGVGRLDKEATSGPAEAFRLVTEDLLVGLYNYKIPLAFVIGAKGGRAFVRIGTWLPKGGSDASLRENQAILRTGLMALYPALQVSDEEAPLGRWPLGGFVLGIPSAKPPDVAGVGLPHDRLLRALTGTSWEALVLAQPVVEAAVREHRLRLINETRSAETAAKLGGVPSPLADHYVKLLRLAVENLTLGDAVGAWRTGVYLLGDEETYYRLVSVWRGVFAGKESLPEPVRIWDREEAPDLATRWAMPDPIGGRPPGLFRQPFDYQTLLTSPQLAAYVHFPDLETNGFSVVAVPDFDTVPPLAKSERHVNLGSVLERGRPTASEFSVDIDRFTRHTFVTGVTGSGKTNTVFHLLRHLASTGTPFLVIEPAKTEYRTILRDAGLGDTLQVFTLGDESVSPFRLNPFEVPPAIPVAVHLDLLRSVFHVSFGMWTPLPQVLEECLHRIYADRGWDVTSNSNRRLDEASDRSRSYPTLTELLAKVDEVTPELGYEERVTADIRAALRTRLKGLRAGGKGRMLDRRASMPIDLLLGRPTVLELQNMGDDDDKAFMMGLLMIRLAEHRRIEGDNEGLQHVLVIEEAHRLLTNPGNRRDETEADVRGKAVETFTNLLSEIRAYGQGVVVVDQIPAKLAPDVVKNTNLKIAHRIVAGDDRATLAAAMAMTARQEHSLATLPVGQAAVFVDGEDAPLLLQVPWAKGGSKTWPSDEHVREEMAGREEIQALAGFYLPSEDCEPTCLSWPLACDAARRMTDDQEVMRAFSRSVLSAVQTRGGLLRTWPELVMLVESRNPPWIDEQELMNSILVHATATLTSRWGTLAGWTYTDTEVFTVALRLTLEGALSRGAEDSVSPLRELLLRLQGGGFGPFAGCERIWGGRDGPCLCRYPVGELVRSGGFDDLWHEAIDSEQVSDAEDRATRWEVSQDAAFHLVEFPLEGQDAQLAEQISDVARCTALCFGQQMLAAQDWSHPRSQRLAINRLIEEAGHE